MKSIALFLLLILAPFGAAQNRNVQFGKPVGTVPYVTGNTDDYHVERPQYVLSHNASRGHPNWVSWSLRKADIGNEPRGSFEPDMELPKASRVPPAWFHNSGFDIGHMCPSKDRSSTREDNDATFLTSNVIPQAPACNEHTWAAFEEHCRKLANEGNILHIVCGPAGTRGEGKNGYANRIAGKINVPAFVWKVVIVLPKDQAKPSKNTVTIAAIVPNAQHVGKDWNVYRCTIAHAEEVSGWKCFPLAEIDRAALPTK